MLSRKIWPFTNIPTKELWGKYLAIFGLYIYAIGSHSSRSLISFGVGFVILSWLIELSSGGEHIFNSNKQIKYWPFLGILLFMMFSRNEFWTALGSGTFYSIIFPMAIINQVESRKIIYRVIGISSFVLTVSAVVANHQFLIENMRRAEGLARFSITSGNVSVMGVALLLPFLFKKWNRKTINVIIGIAIVFNILAITFSLTRGAYLALLIILILFVIIKKPKFLPLLLIGMLIFYTSLPVTFQNRFKSIFADFTEHSRMDIWRASVDMTRDNLLRGVGFDNFTKEYSNYTYENRDTRTSAHNNYLFFATEMGLIAAAIFIYLNYLLLVNFYSAYKKEQINNKDRALYLGIFLSITGFLIAGLFETNITEAQTRNYFWALVGLGLALQALQLREEKDNADQSD